MEKCKQTQVLFGHGGVTLCLTPPLPFHSLHGSHDFSAGGLGLLADTQKADTQTADTKRAGFLMATQENRYP